MKTVIDYSWRPDAGKIDPRIWHHFAHHNTIDGHNFNFIYSFEFHEFPIVSDLAKKLKPTYGALDTDSDTLLNGYLRFWAEDITAYPENETVSEKLKKDIIEYKDILAEHDKLGEDITKLTRVMYGFDDGGSIEDMFKGKRVTTEATEKAEAEYEKVRKISNEVKDKLNKISLSIFKEIVNTGYGPTKYSLYNKSNEDVYYGDLGVDDFTKDSLMVKICTSTNAYHNHILAYPGENLPYYFLDELIFMAYVQTTVANGAELFYGEAVSPDGSGAENLMKDLEKLLNNPMSDNYFIDEFFNMEKTVENVREWFNSYIDSGKGYCWWT